MKNFVNLKKLKKNILLAFVLLFAITAAFADKSRFYQDGKVIDTMYVDSVEGLRVRDKPALKSNRLCGLVHRLPVKVVAIGKEETIDGITAPWFEILIPRYEWKGSEPKYGWVFGGYLSKQKGEFKRPRTKEELKNYLTSFWTWKQVDEYDWKDILNQLNDKYYFGITCFSQNNYYAFIQDKTSINGKYEVLSSDTVLLELRQHEWESYSDDSEYDSVLRTYSVKIKILDISENMFSYEILDNETLLPSGIKRICTGWAFIGNDINMDSVSLYLNDYSEAGRYSVLDKFTEIDEQYGSKKHLNSDYYYSAEFEHTVSASQAAGDFIKAGVSAKGSKYEQQYHDYWNPIMAEHQKKADAMK